MCRWRKRGKEKEGAELRVKEKERMTGRNIPAFSQQVYELEILLA